MTFSLVVVMQRRKGCVKPVSGKYAIGIGRFLGMILHPGRKRADTFLRFSIVEDRSTCAVCQRFLHLCRSTLTRACARNIHKEKARVSPGLDVAMRQRS
ncbi:hypothetical protein [Ralstonia edaphi]|uniref:hypothetical protein n=1 Tax=Ralstonia edaphi TaxID=3058599 RepID=UPI00292E6E91|nr:hypothetical protein [Ralstonia sp. LMG 6871]